VNALNGRSSNPTTATSSGIRSPWARSADIAPSASVSLAQFPPDGDADVTNELIQTLKHEMVPMLCGDDEAQSCVYQDPIVHHRLEVYRKKYR